MNKNQPRQGKTKKRRDKITFLDEDDLFVAFLGDVGWHTRAIAERSGMTESQVNYRLKKAGIVRRNYRDGVSQTAEIVVKVCSPRIIPNLRSQLGSKFV